MVRKVVWTFEAREDLKGIGAYIAASSPANAETVIRDLAQAAAKLAAFPYAHRVIPEFADTERRETFVHKWRLMYRILPDEVRIIGVIHGARLLTNLLPRSFEESAQLEYVAS